jgi:predicted transcriptional regulator
MSCTKTAMYGMLLAGEDKSGYLLLFGDNEEIFVSTHEGEREDCLMLRQAAPVGTTFHRATNASCYKCSEELRIGQLDLQMQRGIADRMQRGIAVVRSAIPRFICSTTENASTQHPAKESRVQNSAARSL